MWYAVNLLFKSQRTPTSGDDPLWEESIRLIEAGTEAEAREKAVQLARADETCYDTINDTVTWVLDRVGQVYAIEADSLASGVEVFSRFLRNSEVQSLLTPFDDE